MGRPERNPIRVGDRFGCLVVAALNFDFHYDPRGYGRKRHLCKCDCGQQVSVMATALKNGNTTSCGCQSSRKKASQRNRTHGHSVNGAVTPEYRAWCKMIERCHGIGGADKEGYSDRGIIVCNEWRDSFQCFLSHIGTKPSREHSIDRINNDGNYEPGNVRWATAKEQNRNKRSNRLLTFQGQTRCVREWEELLGFKQGVLSARLYLGWSGEQLFVPQLKQFTRKARA